MCRFQTNPYLLPEWNEVKYLFYWTRSNRFTLCKEANANVHFHGNGACRGILHQCFGLSGAEFGSHFSHNLNLLRTANTQRQSPRSDSRLPLGTRYPLWAALPLAHTSAFPTGNAPPLLAAEPQLPAAACLFINEFIFSGFEIRDAELHDALTVPPLRWLG